MAALRGRALSSAFFTAGASSLALACSAVAFSAPAADGGADGSVQDAPISRDASSSADGSVPSCPAAKGAAMVRIAAPGGVAPFCIDATEVTKVQYAAFYDAVEGTPAAASLQPAACAWNTTFKPQFDWPPTGRETQPINNVDWCDAYAYCKWAGKRLCGNPAGGPSTAGVGATSAWYLACAGASSNPYPYGASYQKATCNGCDSQGICGKTVYNQTTPIGSMSACVGGYPGLVDMSGNVEEWENLCDGDAGASDICVTRGGGWSSGADALRCDTPTQRRRDAIQGETGFRCCSD